MTPVVHYVRTPHLVRAELLNQAWNWRTSHGERMSAKAGDYRLTDPASGRQWSITAAGLRTGYRSIGGGRFESRGEVTARRAAVPTPVATIEGPETAQIDDWIITDSDGRSWVVNDTWFRERYVEVSPG